ncbi:Uncharacterised protein [Serratia marcescens]|uniref:Uncharacterized protein n=1 Tax=Serratia marcescens TaxID=615 RepID=A0A379YD26_SERMA|nr:Uncharacterised protein [Serratia marcescens]
MLLQHETFFPPELSYVADNLATQTSLASCTIGHNTFRGRNNSDTQTGHNFWQLIFFLVDAQTWTADTLNAFYHSFALEVLQYQFQKQAWRRLRF